MIRIPPEYRASYFKEAIKNGMKLLVADAETSHMWARIWGTGKQYVSARQVKKPSQVICIQYMWASDKKATWLEWDSKGKGIFDDSRMLTAFATEILPKADLILTQNGDRFDIPIFNNRLKVQKLPNLTFKPSIDILKLSRSSFRSESHSLDYRSSQLGFGGKITMAEDDWIDVEERGVPVSKKMAPYGCKDTEDTLKIFWSELPYYKSLPLEIEKVVRKFVKIVCPECESRKQAKFDVEHVTTSKVKCNRCGAKWSL